MLKLTFYKTHTFQGMVGSEWDDTFFWLPLRDQKEWTKGGATWKWILTIFKYLTECFKQLQQKKRWKNGVICLVFMFSSYVMVKKVHILQFCSDLSNKPKSVKAIYMYVSESSHYKGLSHRYEILATKISKKMLTQQNLTIFFDFKP